MPPRPVNRATTAAANLAATDEPRPRSPIVLAFQDTEVEPAEANSQPTANIGATPSTYFLPALSPTHASDEVIDYSTSDRMKLYSASIATLPMKDFEGTEGNVQTWINDLIERAQAMNWIAILTVVINGISFLIPRCFTLTIQQVQDHARS
jgi:hypothetical protein